MSKVAAPPRPVETPPARSGIAALVAELDVELHAGGEVDAQLAAVDATIEKLKASVGDDPAAALLALEELLGAGIVEELHAREEIVGVLHATDEDLDELLTYEDELNPVSPMVDRERLRALELDAARTAAEVRGAAPTVLALYEDASARQWAHMERLAGYERELDRLRRRRAPRLVRRLPRPLAAARERRARRTSATGTASSRGDPPADPEPPSATRDLRPGGDA